MMTTWQQPFLTANLQKITMRRKLKKRYIDTFENEG